MIYKFELSHNAMEATKNIHRVKGEGTLDHSTGTRWFEKFCLRWKNFKDQPRSGKPKSVESKAISKPGISKSSMICYLHHLSKSCQIVPHIIKILQNF